MDTAEGALEHRPRHGRSAADARQLQLLAQRIEFDDPLTGRAASRSPGTGNLVMSEENALVIVAGYQDLDSARRDFETLTDRTKDKHIPLRGAVLVGKDDEGNPVLVDTGNRLGRRGAAWGAGAGLAVGLFSPALLASAAVGAAAGALAGTFANHRIKSGLADKIGQALAAGSGVIIAVVPPQGRLAIEQALSGSADEIGCGAEPFDA